MWGMLAEGARWLGLRARDRAEGFLGRSARSNLRSEFWFDVQAWCDGLETWPNLRFYRKRRAEYRSRSIVRET